ncbi:hypothetical protein P7C70_g3910, partial [Phenoliferia sp. Uapishka_3]
MLDSDFANLMEGLHSFRFGAVEFRSCALGWNYVYAYFMLVPEQIVVEFWTSSVNVAVWISIFLVVITLLNSLSVRFYGETESYFASLKIILILGLILLTFITMVGGGPSHHAFGFSNWNKPSPMVNPLWLLPVQAFDSDSSISDQNEYIATGAWGRFLAFWSSMISAGFSFIFGPELITVASGETQNPRRNIPKATRRFVYRIVFFYVGGILSIGILVSSQNPSLLNAIASGTSSGAASPFVIGIREQGIKVLPSIVNAVILTSAWSSGNSFMYAGARVLHGLAKDRHAPSFFARTHHGVPLYAVGCAALIGCLSYLNVSSSGANVFTWFQNITTISGFLSWIVVLITHFRFRAGLKAQGVSISSLPFRAKLYPYAPIYALIVVSVITLTNGFAVFTKGRWSTSDFVAAYIGLPIFAFFYLGHKIVTRSWDFYIPAHLIDITTGRAEIDEEERLDRQNFVPPTTFNEKFVEWLF